MTSQPVEHNNSSRSPSPAASPMVPPYSSVSSSAPQSAPVSADGREIIESTRWKPDTIVDSEVVPVQDATSTVPASRAIDDISSSTSSSSADSQQSDEKASLRDIAHGNLWHKALTQLSQSGKDDDTKVGTVKELARDVAKPEISKITDSHTDLELPLQPSPMTHPSWLPDDCQICEDIWAGLSQPQGASSQGIKIHVGDPESALSMPCDTHRPLILHLNQYNVEVPTYTTREIRESGITSQNSSVRCHWNLLVKKSVPTHPGTGRVIDPEWIDVNLVRKWKEKCCSSHGSECATSLKTRPAGPAWLIDVKQGCLVPRASTDGASYIALSYVYGRQIGCPITTEMLMRLTRPHSLNNVGPDSDTSKWISPIVRHAMHLTSAIGERFLWADSLCIMHHDLQATAEQLNLMGSIYAGALVTIVSLQGDAMDGLCGLRDVSGPRRGEQAVVAFGDERLVAYTPWHASDLENSGDLYPTRAWTYQEYLLSPRKILFLKDRMHWVCKRSCWHEDVDLSATILGEEAQTSRFPTGTHHINSLPDLSLLVQQYSRKKLRYGEDALPAISGPLTILSPVFTGGFLYGIPELLFEWGLAWTPSSATAQLRRRTQSERPAESRLHPSELPSWSWISWEGDIAMSARRDATVVRYGCPWTSETIPITEWFTGHSPRDPPTKRRRVRSRWYEKRDSYKRAGAGLHVLPPGWTRHHASDAVRRLHPSTCGQAVFRHKKLFGLSEFYYPIPHVVVGEPSTLSAMMPEQTPFLFCETMKTRLWGLLDHHNIVSLHADSWGGAPGGYLHLHSEDDGILFADSQSRWDVGSNGLSVELVAVCKLEIRHAEQTHATQPEIQVQERYAVLWVVWKDGVGYRRASGEVDVELWERSGPESISLILG